MESIVENQQPSSPDSDSSVSAASKTYNQKFLINKLNYINFVDGTITATFRHQRYLTTLSLQVKPLPCSDEKLNCLWIDAENLKQTLQTHDFLHLLISDGQKSLVVLPEIVEVSEQGLKILLPQKCTELKSRKSRRYACHDISVQLIQNGTFFQGTLVNFSAVSVNITLVAAPPQTFQWINPSVPANLVFSNAQGTVFTGEFKILSQSCGQNERTLILALANNEIRKFKPKKYRSNRQCLLPSPNIHFTHPLTGCPIELKVINISGSGFSVEEDSFNSHLLPGLILPEAKMVFADGGILNFKAQVIYRKDSDEKKDRVKCGIAILDMKIEDQVKLLGSLYQAHNEQSYLSNEINLDLLWEFFFETGFMYPQKYVNFQINKVALKNTYHKLYSGKPNIAKHFIYQDNGKILAHMSMIRFFRNSWLIHHHASQKLETHKGGLIVLGQISRYVNEVHRLYSARLDYVFGYYRSENKFPRRYFGGAAQFINNPKACSVDPFAYLHFNKFFDKQWEVVKPWSLQKTTDDDLKELNRFLAHASGGLMTAALNLEPGAGNDEELVNEYQEIDLKKERHLFSLRIQGDLKAIVVVNISDMGINLSDLNNSIKVIVIDSDNFNRDILYLMLSMLCVTFGLDQVPVLLYPHTFAEEKHIPFEKIYNLWILNMQNLDEYFDFCQGII